MACRPQLAPGRSPARLPSATGPLAGRTLSSLQRERIATAFLCASALLSAFAGQARGSESDFHAKLSYEVDTSLPGCWDEGDFRKKVAHRVGYDPFRSDAPTSVAVRVEGAATAIGGSVYWQDIKGATIGERRFVARDGNCGKLVAEMAFAVALQIQMLGLASHDPSEGRATDEADSARSAASAAPPPESLPASDHTKETGPPSTEEADQSRPVPLAMWVGLGPQAAYGVAPGWVADGRIFFGLRRGSLSFELGAESTYPAQFRRWSGSGFRELFLAGSLALCHHEGPALGCLLGKAGELRAGGLGLDAPLSPAAFVAYAGARLGAQAALSKSWFLGIHADGLVLLTPCTITISGTPVWDLPRIAGFAGLDIAARFR